MNSTVQYTLIRGAIRLTVVAAMLATAVSTAVAAELPGPASGDQTLAQAPASVVGPGDVPPGTQEAEQAGAALASLLPLHRGLGHYRIFRPASWYTLDLSDDRTDGILIAFDQQDHSTYLSVEVSDNSLVVTDTDLPWLIQSFSNRLTVRPGAQLEWQTQYAQGTTWVFEAKYTYPNKMEEGKRWVRVVYTGARRYLVVAEAPTLLDYAAAEPVFLAMMATFTVD